MAAPAVMVVGALAAMPQVRHLLSPAPAAAARQVSAANLATGRIADPGLALSAAIGEAGSARRETYFSQRAKTASGRGPAAPARKRAAPVSSPPDSPAVSVTPQAAASSAPVSAAPAAAPAAASGGQGTPNCTGSGGMLPENFAAIVDFLVAHGYADNAAAGIAGNMYQESGGNPESVGSGGGGLIGWTPLPAGYVTGNPSADLQTQLAAVLTFNSQWSQYLPALNAAGTPAAAADIYVTDFERAGIPAASNREASANAVAAACHI
ncbi:MAG TPA: phage tail tip lysozyme [Streptosporangiaceae bacterium]|nr:phage tail tip lysozyme [Streptosporangiaceae bacterium]